MWILLLIPIIILTAKIGARYWVENDRTAPSAPYDYDRPPSDTAWISTPEGKAEMMRQQVVSKIHWGAQDREVYEWLQERHGLTGSKADEILAHAHRAKRKAVRAKAFIMLVVSGCGVIFGGVFVIARLWYHAALGWVGDGADFIGCISLLAFLRSLWLLFTGKTEGSVD